MRGVEVAEHPVQKRRSRLVVELRLGETGNATQVLAAAGQHRDARHRTAKFRNRTRQSKAFGLMATLAMQHVVEGGIPGAGRTNVAVVLSRDATGRAETNALRTNKSRRAEYKCDGKRSRKDGPRREQGAGLGSPPNASTAAPIRTWSQSQPPPTRCNAPRGSRFRSTTADRCCETCCRPAARPRCGCTCNARRGPDRSSRCRR